MLGLYRLLLALGVLWSHAGVIPWPVARTMVSCFFVISGYLIALTLSRHYHHRPGAFYWNRFLRIYPLFWCSSLMALVVIASAGLPPFMEPFEPTQALQSLTLVPHWSWLLIGPAWTLPYELCFYLLAPLLVRLRSTMLLGLLVSISAVSLLAGHMPGLLEPFLLAEFPLAYPDLARFFSQGLVASMPLFLLGMLVFRASERLPKPAIGSIVPLSGNLLLLLLFPVSFYWMPLYHYELDWAQRLVMTWFIVPNTCLLLFFWQRRESRLMNYLGELCYPIYLLHWFALRYVLPNITWDGQSLFDRLVQTGGEGSQLGALLLGVATTLLTLGLSALWLTVEPRIRRLRSSHHKEFGR